jgi:hypothetical protein
VPNFLNSRKLVNGPQIINFERFELTGFTSPEISDVETLVELNSKGSGLVC